MSKGDKHLMIDAMFPSGQFPDQSKLSPMSPEHIKITLLALSPVHQLSSSLLSNL